jgi:threonine synthase
LTQKYPVTLVNSLNPHRIEGQKTAAFEIIDDLGDAPDYLFIPVGNAGNITAYWKGFVEYYQCRQSQPHSQDDGLSGRRRCPDSAKQGCQTAQDHCHSYSHWQSR